MVLTLIFIPLSPSLLSSSPLGWRPAYFRYSEQEGFDEGKVFGAGLAMIALVLASLGLFVLLFQSELLHALRWEETPEYLYYFMAILALDALSALPFARLRRTNKAVRFARNKIGFDLLQCVDQPLHFPSGPIGNCTVAQAIGPHEMRGVGYIFVANFWAAILMFALLLPTLFPLRLNLDKKYVKTLLVFGIPLLIGGLAGIANEMLDRQLLKYLLPEESAYAGVGIYGAVYKISIFLILFNQAFRYAAEPFFFKNAKTKEGPERMSTVMDGFAWVMCVGFVLIISGLDYLKFFVDEKFWTGLHLVPILLLANVILGINTNLNVWYKVSDKTVYGIYITFVGLIITVVGNVILIPVLGILGAAFTTLAAYFAMFIASVLWGRKHYPVPYRWKKIGAFLGFACLVVFILHYTNWPPGPLKVFGGIVYLGIMLFWERNGLLKFATRK